jgi:hypothetical protein
VRTELMEKIAVLANLLQSIVNEWFVWEECMVNDTAETGEIVFIESSKDDGNETPSDPSTSSVIAFVNGHRDGRWR